jgi:hypothetical protein
MDSVVLVNLILSLIILVMGIWAYAAGKARPILFTGIAFGLFAVTHLLNVLGQAANLSILILVIRLAAYLVVIYALYLEIIDKKNN